tara:strand:+ start:261 stop:455 length:195 start_codon:yes stop_codon:yes gene_type:complete
MALGPVVSYHTNYSPYFVLEQYTDACTTGSLDRVIGGSGVLWEANRLGSGAVFRGFNAKASNRP